MTSFYVWPADPTFAVKIWSVFIFTRPIDMPLTSFEKNNWLISDQQNDQSYNLGPRLNAFTIEFSVSFFANVEKQVFSRIFHQNWSDWLQHNDLTKFSILGLNLITFALGPMQLISPIHVQTIDHLKKDTKKVVASQTPLVLLSASLYLQYI